MMKTTVKILASNDFTSIKEAGVAYAKEFGFVPTYKTFRFSIHSGYEWGHGYTNSLQREFFEETVCPAVAKAMDWSFIRGESSCDCPFSAKYNEGYMYMHPMEITGYIKPELIDKLVNAFNKFGDGKVTVSSDVTWYFDVFDMKDRDVAKYYYLHKDAFKSELKELLFENPILKKNIPTYIPVFYNKETKEYRTERIYTSAGYNDSLLYRLFHIIAKPEDECTTHSEAFDFFYDVMDVIINELFEEKFFKTVGKKPDNQYTPIKYVVK